MLPFNLGSPAEFAAVRELLLQVGFTPENVARRVGVETIHDFVSLGAGRKTATSIEDSLDVLIRLFMDGRPVPIETVHELLPPGSYAALEKLGLIAPYPREPEACAASLQLYPIKSVFIASDLESTAPGLANPDDLEPPDHVFSALTSLTGTYLKQLPDTPCRHYLELCSGTGVAALVAARYSEHVWAADITERSTRFAEFNARLNGMDNFSAVRGDLYEPVAGMSFDRIVAHPPYVAASENTMVYRDGGEDGEDVIRRILAGLPDHLAPGGHFYMTCVTSDRRGAPFEERVRAMVGEREEDFDLLVVTHHAMAVAEYYCRLAASGRIPFTMAEQRIKSFRELEAVDMVYCSLVLQRHTRSRPPFTLRRERREASAAKETDWLLRWNTRLAEEDILPLLMEARPRLLPHPRLEVLHRVESGEWKVASSKLQIEYPFVRTVEISLNGSMLLTLCDGTHTVREILERVQAAGAISTKVPELSFAEFIRELITEGVLGIGDEPTYAPAMATEPATEISAV